MKRCISVLCIAIFAGSAMADVTYTYTGHPLSITKSQSSGDPALETAPLTIVLDFSSDGSALLNWSISQSAMGTIDPSNVFGVKTGNIGDSPAIYFYTDASGAVSSWYVGAEVLDPNSPPGTWWFSKSAQSWCGVVLGSPPLAYGIYAEEAANAGFNANDCGTWSAAGGVLANFSYGDRADLATLQKPVPEPSDSLLLLAGFAALSIAARKRGPQFGSHLHSPRRVRAQRGCLGGRALAETCRLPESRRHPTAAPGRPVTLGRRGVRQEHAVDLINLSRIQGARVRRHNRLRGWKAVASADIAIAAAPYGAATGLLAFTAGRQRRARGQTRAFAG